jgi:branched-chain amino acid aminotransferase
MALYRHHSGGRTRTGFSKGDSNKEDHITLTDLFNADECFLTGTAARVVPVSTINQRMIGKGEPDPLHVYLWKRLFD